MKHIKIIALCAFTILAPVYGMDEQSSDETGSQSEETTTSDENYTAVEQLDNDQLFDFDEQANIPPAAAFDKENNDHHDEDDDDLDDDSEYQEAIPLINAIRQGPNALRAFLDNGGDPNLGEEFGLFEAVTRNDYDATQMLLQHGGTNWVREARVRARELGYQNLVGLLNQYNPLNDPNHEFTQDDLFDAATAGAVDDVNVCLAHGIDVNVRDFDSGVTPLMVAAYWHQRAVVERLLQEPTIDVNRRDRHGKTALEIATDDAEDAAIRALLIQHGAH